MLFVEVSVKGVGITCGIFMTKTIVLGNQSFIRMQESETSWKMKLSDWKRQQLKIRQEYDAGETFDVIGQ